MGKAAVGDEIDVLFARIQHPEHYEMDGSYLERMEDRQRIVIEAKLAIRRKLLEGRIDTLSKLKSSIKPRDKHSGDSWNRGYVSAEIKLTGLIKAEIKQLTAELEGLGK